MSRTLRPTPGVGPGDLVSRVDAALGTPGAVRTGPEQRAAELAATSQSVTRRLVAVGVFAGLAVVAAAVIVTSLFRIVHAVARVDGPAALRRCEQAPGLGAVLAEAMVTGVAAGVLGVGVAVLGGYAVLAVLRGTGTGFCRISC